MNQGIPNVGIQQVEHILECGCTSVGSPVAHSLASLSVLAQYRARAILSQPLHIFHISIT